MGYFQNILCITLLGVQFILPTSAKSQDTIKVFVSIPPQKYLVERIGGNNVQVSVMVSAGQSPATYEPTPRQMAALSEAQLYFQIGVPFETVWIDGIRQLNNKLKIIECCDRLVSRELSGHSHHEIDPHIWTSPVNAKLLATMLKRALTELDPHSKNYYERNYDSLINDLDELDQHIHAQLDSIANRYLIVSHPSWGHFSDTYNLHQIPIEQNGSEIRARSLIEIIELAKQEKIHTIFVQKQFNKASAEILAREINAQVIELDPLAENYIENLRQVANAIAQGIN